MRWCLTAALVGLSVPVSAADVTLPIVVPYGPKWLCEVYRDGGSDTVVALSEDEEPATSDEDVYAALILSDRLVSPGSACRFGSLTEYDGEAVIALSCMTNGTTSDEQMLFLSLDHDKIAVLLGDGHEYVVRRCAD